MGTGANALYGHSKWRRSRAAYLRMNPSCKASTHAQGCRGLAEVVDHIVPRSAGGSTWDRGNWQGLSKLCHDAKTRREQGRLPARADAPARPRPARIEGGVVTGDYTAVRDGSG